MDSRLGTAVRTFGAANNGNSSATCLHKRRNGRRGPKRAITSTGAGRPVVAPYHATARRRRYIGERYRRRDGGFPSQREAQAYIWREAL